MSHYAMIFTMAYDILCRYNNYRLGFIHYEQFTVTFRAYLV